MLILQHVLLHVRHVCGDLCSRVFIAVPSHIFLSCFLSCFSASTQLVMTMCTRLFAKGCIKPVQAALLTVINEALFIEGCPFDTGSSLPVLPCCMQWHSLIPLNTLQDNKCIKVGDAALVTVIHEAIVIDGQPVVLAVDSTGMPVLLQVKDQPTVSGDAEIKVRVYRLSMLGLNRTCEI